MNKEEIILLAEKLHVLVVDENTRVIYVNKPTKISSESCIWNIVYLTRAKIVKSFPYFTATHSFGYQGLFKPSMEEIILSMDEDLKSLINQGEVNSIMIQYLGFTSDYSMHISKISAFLAEYDSEVIDKFTEW